jgi:hypothetical protein
MFKVFSGSWRGIGAETSPEVLFMQIGFGFRQHLHHFKSASLSVFLCIVLHANPQGESFPSYEQIQTETGLSPDTIGRALKHLKKLTIEGQRVLLTFRLRDEKNRFIGGNRYIVFPTAEQLAEHEGTSEPQEKSGEPEPNRKTEIDNQPEQTPAAPDEKSQTPIFPNVENAELGKSELKKNHSLKKIKNMGAAAPVRPAPNPEERIAAFPVDCQPGAKLIVSLFNLRPPEKPNPRQKGGDFGLWINGIRELNIISAEYNTPLDAALKATWKRWNNSPFTVAHPGALAKTMLSVLASQTQPNETPVSIQSALEQAMPNFTPRR